MFQIVQHVGGVGVDPTLPYGDGSDGGPYLALGDMVCADKYLLMHAHVCSRAFQRAPLHLPEMFDFPHLTFAKLEFGHTLRQANSTFWVSDLPNGTSELDITAVVRCINEGLRKDATLFQLHPVHLEHNWYGHRYDVTGGEGRSVFRRIQALLRQECASLGECVGYWAEEPAHPHITFEYPQEDEDEARWERDSATGSGSATSGGSSLRLVTDKLAEKRLGRLRPIFERERLSVSVLPALTHERLQAMGVKSFGDRQKVLAFAAELAAAPAAARAP